MFDATGAHVRTIGRRGGGPGEFMQPVAVHVAPDGHLWVVDVGNVRISVPDTAGRHVGGMLIPTRFKMTPWLGGGFDGDGRFYAPVWATPSESEMVGMTRR